jgi:hypothetical protein
MQNDDPPPPSTTTLPFVLAHNFQELIYTSFSVCDVHVSTFLNHFTENNINLPQLILVIISNISVIMKKKNWKIFFIAIHCKTIFCHFRRHFYLTCPKLCLPVISRFFTSAKLLYQILLNLPEIILWNSMEICENEVDLMGGGGHHFA